jgi:hypothetical protein
MRSGRRARRFSFSTLRYCTCLASCLSVAWAMRRIRDWKSRRIEGMLAITLNARDDVIIALRRRASKVLAWGDAREKRRGFKMFGSRAIKKG